VFWVKALPSRAHGAAIIQRLELDRLSVRSAIADRLPNAHALGRGSAAFRPCVLQIRPPRQPCSSLREDPEPRPTNLGPSQLFPLTERSLETKKAPAFSPALFFRKIALGPLASYQFPHLRQPLCQPPLPHLRPPLPQFRQPLCQLPHPVNCMPLWSDVDLVCSTIAVRTRATRSEIVA
jgi:hypothetical protein